jgi:tRNA threonylcarbamoyladenosine biosynthesis protein TsaE
MEYALAEAARRGHSELHVGVRLALTANRRWYARLGYAELGHRRHEGTGAVNWAELVAFVPVISESPEEKDTRMFGQRLARVLRAGDLVVLTGPLGAGKTVVAQGIGAGLGVTGAVVSPTFVIARVHRGGRVPMVHVDAYRLSSVAEVDDLDLDASLEESVTVVEWGLGKVEQLADSHLQVDLTRRDDDTRQIEVIPFGAAWLDRDVRAAVSP